MNHRNELHKTPIEEIKAVEELRSELTELKQQLSSFIEQEHAALVQRVDENEVNIQANREELYVVREAQSRIENALGKSEEREIEMMTKQDLFMAKLDAFFANKPQDKAYTKPSKPAEPAQEEVKREPRRAKVGSRKNPIRTRVKSKKR